MEESTTYQAIIQKGVDRGRREGRQEGRLVQARENIIEVGRIRLGQEPPQTVVDHLNSITNLTDINCLLSLVVRMESWSELLEG